jgi:hypothetical protein
VRAAGIMKVKKEVFPYILLLTFVVFFILGVFMGFTPSH